MTSERFKIFDELQQGVQVIDPDFRYIYLNEVVATHAKSTVNDLVGYEMEEKFPGIQNTKLFEKIRDCMTHSREANLKNEFEFPDGSIGYFELRMERIKEGVIIFSYDATEMVLEQINSKREKTALESELQEKLEELELKNEELKQFSYITSHDLQEPLRTLRGYVDIIQRNYKDSFDDRGLKYLEFIMLSVDRMSDLINDLLEYSRLGNQREKEEVDLNELLQEVLHLLEAAIASSGAKITMDELPIVYCNKTHLTQLFQNLLSNAIKFKKDFQSPVVHISSERKDGYWIFCIEDNGIGIPEKHHHKIFKVFQRLHNRQKFEGTGIGLAHCAKIIEMNEGKIWVESEPGSGSRFYFTIPCTNGK